MRKTIKEMIRTTVALTGKAALLAVAVATSAPLSVLGGDSAPFLLDTADGTRIATEGEAVPIAYSPRWGNAASCTVTTAGAPSLRTDEGEIIWTPQGIGGHTLTHTAGDLVYTAQFAVLGDDVAVHGGTSGTIGTSETWAADKTHLVTMPLTIPSGISLTIEPGAVVKFMPGASLTVTSGGSCTAKGVIFTHVNDDTIGGDTLCDGNAVLPVMDDYTITGNVVEDGATERRYAFYSGTLLSSLTWNSGTVHVIDGQLSVPSGVTFTIQSGAVVKFMPGASLTVANGGSCTARGVIFTHVNDDTIGGDTLMDGDPTRQNTYNNINN